MSVSLDAELRLGVFDYRACFEADREVVVLFGHSGAGKSVSLQLIAGLLTPDRGTIAIDGVPVTDTGRRIMKAPQERNVGYVVQSLALFTHMSVAENIRFGMPPGVNKRERLAELLELLDLKGFDDRKPTTLSGGQQQRVALARALARNATVLLLDEPFSALDESLRSGLRRELVRLRKELGLTILFVTHDLREAHLLADRLAVFDGGQVLQFGRRDDVFRRPASRRVAELTGVENLLAARVTGGGEGYAEIDVAGLPLRCASVSEDALESPTPFAGIRAERVNLRRPHDAVPPNHLMGRVSEEWSYGNTHTVRFEPSGRGPALTVELASRPYEVLGVEHQREWLIELPPEDLHLMPG